MNKKEISEIKKQFTPAHCCITRICGCYVDAEKKKKTELNRTFLGLPEEEMFKYFDIFRKTLSGSLGKNLMNMDFPLKEEYSGGAQEFLLQLKNSSLEDSSLTNALFDKIIEHYNYPENYYIILIHAAYDVPGRTKDGLEMEDASDETYSFLLCSICPVSLSKAGLCYNEQTNCIEDRTRDWVVGMPDLGFLFPVFNDRSTDIHSLLYYSKNTAEFPEEFIQQLFGCTAPLTAAGQKETFNAIIEETLGNDCDLDTVRNIHEKLGEIMLAAKEEPEPVILAKEEVKNLLASSGIADNKLDSFEQNYTALSGESPKPFMVSNLVNTRKFEIKTPDVQINVAPERMDLVETRVLDGRHCLVIPMEDNVEVNGIRVRTSSGILDPSTGEILE